MCTVNIKSLHILFLSETVKRLKQQLERGLKKKNNVVPIIIIRHKQDTPIGAATSEVVVFVVTYSMQYSDTTLARC